MKMKVWILFGALGLVALGAGVWLGTVGRESRDPGALLALSLPDAAGNQQALSQWQGKVVVINFWATWCVPCVKELPNFEKLNDEYKNENLKVLLVNLDYKSKLNSSVLPFIKKNRIKNEVFMLNEPDPEVYINRIDPSWSGALPATLMLKDKRRKFFEKDFT